MAWRRAPDAEQACGHQRFRVVAAVYSANTYGLQYRQCIGCGLVWCTAGTETPPRQNIEVAELHWGLL